MKCRGVDHSMCAPTHHPKPDHVWHYILGGGWCLAGPLARLHTVQGRLYNAGRLGNHPTSL